MPRSTIVGTPCTALASLAVAAQVRDLAEALRLHHAMGAEGHAARLAGRSA